MEVMDQDIDTFVKEIHSYNSARPPNGKILIPLNVPQSLKLVLFELRNKKRCGALPNGLVLQAINVSQLNIIHKARKESLEIIAHRKDQSFPDMTVPKLTSDDFEDFDLDFKGVARRQYGLYGIPLEYLLRPIDAGNYDVVWNSRDEKLKNCVIFVGQSYKDDAESVYTLLVQHVWTSGPGSNIISKQINYKNGRRCCLDLKGNFLTESHDQTKAPKSPKQHIQGESATGKLRTIIILCPKNLMILSKLAEYMHFKNIRRSIILNVD